MRLKLISKRTAETKAGTEAAMTATMGKRIMEEWKGSLITGIRVDRETGITQHQGLTLLVGPSTTLTRLKRIVKSMKGDEAGSKQVWAKP